MDPTTTTAPMENDCETEPSSVWSWWPSWRPTSMSLLKTAESKILACIQNDLWARFVTLPNQDRIWTLSLTSKVVHKPAEQAHKTPLVMVHGFGGGVGLWIRNLDALSRSRPVYAFDLLGFGRSSRPPFPSDAAKAEEQFVSSIEQWRQSVGLENMILLGHSLGGYLATSYAIQYPSRVSHLILVDPWGFPERPETQAKEGQSQSTEVVKRPPLPRWVKAIAAVVSLFNPLAVIRAAGPWVEKWVSGPCQNLWAGLKGQCCSGFTSCSPPCPSPCYMGNGPGWTAHLGTELFRLGARPTLK
ncbi:(Lyso)-N-acylphosphatidylethanolamine lipase isoform X2 [Mastacembelus armatus]|uniref:(Lyso)-N-acylphosphatidylethanolamine lipase isoform X2 n=1 Tax=Mastacembelus armatus TaxID=205130 RepID=UPI000E460953|nr:(Lyso)-N-acylphosphatidylethanolamine lipase isoform X2 [Mastacembelus armatus]